MKNFAILLAALALTACAPTRVEVTDEGTDPVPSGGDESDAWFRLHTPTLIDADGDGVWSPGETITLGLLFTNQREDHWRYPGVLSSTDVSEVTPQEADYWWFGIEAGATYEVWFHFEAPTDLPDGTLVTLIAEASALNCDTTDAAEEFCPEPNPLLVPVRLGQPLPEL